MIKFLLQRPIAVFMAFTACFIVGLVVYFGLPVSLLPDIAIPQITVQMSAEGTSARELENTMVTPIRRQLMQVAGLKEIESETRDGGAVIRMQLEFGVDTDLAFIEVNEKIDAAMGSLPRDTQRPRVIKASATDIPVLYLNMTLKHDPVYAEADEKRFLEMTELAENVVKRRIEQLPEVAMADITGVPSRMIQIVPDLNKLAINGISIEELESILAANNVEAGSMLVRDGYYEYNIRIATLLRTLEDVENIYLKTGERILQLKDLARVQMVAKEDNGQTLAGGKRAVTLAIIKQSDENMDRMKQSLKETTDYFAALYPDIDFTVMRNQTELLDYTIQNLQQNLILGFLFILVVTMLFLGDVRASLIIGGSMVVSIVITFLLFYLFHVSLNVVSLSGLILAVGMMIDNAIIVTDNISQHRERGSGLMDACADGVRQMITPMLSSSMTTVAVFLPLIFMSGIAGAIFMDQAFSITAGLAVSYITAIMLLPVLYLMVYKKVTHHSSPSTHHSALSTQHSALFYDRGIAWVFAHKRITLLLTLLTIPLCVFFFQFIRKERMPAIEQQELVARIEWNEHIHINENNRRVHELMKMSDAYEVAEHSAYVGVQDYILNSGSELTATEAELYFKTNTTDDVAPLQTMLQKEIGERYPHATVTFSPPENIFEKLFVTAEADLVAQLHETRKNDAVDVEGLRMLERDIAARSDHTTNSIAFRNQLELMIDQEKLLLYNVSYDNVIRSLRTAFKENQVSVLRSYQQYLPISIAGKEQSVNSVLTETLVPTAPNEQGEVGYIPLHQLVTTTVGEDLKDITAGKNGEYIPLGYYDVDDVPALMESIEKVVDEDKEWDVDFSGSYFSNEQMMGELVVILLVSVLLMYFILCAQFESFVQPLIVLVEIPIDTAFALITLWVCGHTLNLMSAIGIIVTCGIVVNDSILKIDSINELRKAGMPMYEAIHTAGKRRLRAIIMTSLTTILAMVPLLFTSDMGSELQKPLAIAMIGSMVVGTLVSLFVVPLAYYLVEKLRIVKIKN